MRGFRDFPLLETVATLAMVALGVIIGLFSLDIHYHPQNALNIINFLEPMFVWATYSNPGSAPGADLRHAALTAFGGGSV